MSTKVEIVYALHNFEAENEDEITFQSGEPITVIEKDEKYLDGWWKGRDPRGNVGLFPMNYTTHIKPNNSKNDEIENNNDNEIINDNNKNSNSTVSKVNIEQQVNALNNLHTTPTIHPETSIPPSSSLDANYTTVPSTKLSSSSDSNPENWDVNQVCIWLESAGLENVIDIFTEQEITGDVLVELTMDSLKELGIPAYGRRYKVMTAINKLNSSTKKSTSHNTLEDINEVENEQSIPKGPVPKVTTSTSRIPPSSHQRDTKYTPSMISTVSTSTGGPSSMNYQSNLSSPIESDNLYQFPRKAPQPPSSASSVTTHDNSLRPMSSTSLGSSSNNNISRSNTFNTTSTVLTSKSNETKSSPFSSLKQNDISRDAAHPRVSISTPTITSAMNHHDRFQHEMSARINQPADQTLSIISIDSSLQRPSTDEFQAPEHEGWLHKQSDRYKTWNKRWFVLKGTNLFYFKSPKDVRMKGIINLRGYRVIVDETIHSNKYCFKAQHEQERTFFFYTDTADSMRLWIQALMKATIIRDFTSPVMSSNQVATIPLDVAQRMRPRPPSVLLSKTQQINETMQKVDEEDEYDINERNRIENESGISGRSMHKNYQYNHNHKGGDLHDDSDEDVDPFKHEKYTTNNNISSDTNNIKNNHHNHNNNRSSVISATTTINNNNKLQREWTYNQYIHWINQYLPEGKKVVDLSSAFRNGDTLIILLETLSGKKVRRNPDQKGGSVSMKILDSIVNAFKFMGVNGVVVNGNYTIKDIFGGNEEKIMDMVDAIKTWADVNGYGEKSTIKEGEDTSSSIIDDDEENAYTTVSTTNEKNSNFSMILPETPVDHEGFSKSFFNETLHHMKDNNPQHPQHVA